MKPPKGFSMKYPTALHCILSGILLACTPARGGPASAASAESGPRRNVCLIQFDSWDGRILGGMGHAAVQNATPNCDRLSERGVLFRNAYCSHPICCPSRANMWSGRYTHHVESWNNYKGLEPGATTFKDRLEEVGYRFASEQGGIGKHDYRSGGHSQLARITAWTATANINLPFFRPDPPRVIESRERRVHKRDWELVDRACAWLTQNARGEGPFFLYVSMGIPHPAFVTSRYWLSRIDMDAVTIPPADDEDHPVMRFQRTAKNWGYGFDDDTVRRTRAIYYAMCAEADAMVGQLLDRLEDLGLDEDTYVILTSDHGENNMEHRQWYKMNMYESSVRVPLIVAGPGLLEGATIDNVVSLIDLYPTLVDMGRATAPDDPDGESLMPLLAGRTTASRNWALAIFTGCSANTSMFMLRRGNWKYVAYPGYKPQLFNLKDDPQEVHDLADLRTSMVNEMDRRLRSIVDYEEVHGRWLQYCRTAFRQWRGQVTTQPVHLKEYGADIAAASYEQIMANTYIGWDERWSKKLDDWLAE
jgi:arylsulfatase K